MKPKSISFAYVQPLSFSGQSAASELLIAGLAARGWECRRIPIYPLDRAIVNPALRYARFVLYMMRTWLGLLRLSFGGAAILNLNLGQSLASFLRVGLPFVCLKLMRRKLKVITSLHGSVFMEWERTAPVAKVFLWYLRQSHAITVLGQKQREKLIEMGVGSKKIHIVPNTCELELEPEAKVEAKLSNQDKVNLLHLSLLIESKGYPEFLEALELLSKDSELPCEVEAVLCGPMAFTAYCRRFTNEVTKEEWIESKIRSICEQKDTRVNVTWISGAQGNAKAELFRAAQLFVFPSTFPVEAQPLVLLEAMASGCALITSTVGEIPSTVDESVAILEEEPTAEALARDIKTLLESPAERVRLGLGGVKRMREKYSISAHLDNWERVIGDVL